MQVLLHNPEVDSWHELYKALGVLDWFKQYGIEPDCKHIYMTLPFQQYVSLILEDKYATARKRSYDGFARRTSKWNTVMFSPCDIDNDIDCMIIDPSGKTRQKLIKEFKDYMPDFKRNK